MSDCSLDMYPEYWIKWIEVKVEYWKYSFSLLIGLIIFMSVFPVLPLLFVMSIMLASVKFFMLKFRNL